MVATLLETTGFMMAQLATEAARGGENHPVREEHDVLDSPEYGDIFNDDTSERALHPAGVKAARQTGLEFIASAGVGHVVPRLSLKLGVPSTGGHQQGDEVGKIYHGRYVTKESRRCPKGSLVAEVFARKPSLSCSKFLLALVCTDRFPDENGVSRKSSRTQCAVFTDVKRAHFMKPARRRIAVELPQELREPEVYEVGLLKTAQFGTRDAAMCWEAEIASPLVGSMEFSQGRGSPCNFYHKNNQLRVSVYGDHFSALKCMPEQKWFAAGLNQLWIINEKGILGPPNVEGTTQELRHLDQRMCHVGTGSEAC